MRVLSRTPTQFSRESSQTTARASKRRGISLSREKSREREGGATDRRPSASPCRGEGLRERRRVAEQFIIYDVDRHQWEQNKQRQASHTAHLSNSLHVSVVDDKENLQFDSALSLNLERRLPDAPRDRNRAREVRSRIVEIEQRINYLLRNTQMR